MPNAQSLMPSYMQYALRLAERGLGRTWPNPSVGAVIVRDGQVLGCGLTARGGRPHGETAALAQAGANARGATLYVTLEPCAHTGKTPPCTQAIIEAGIARVVAGCTDPNPKVAGKGFAQLREAGIEVVESCLESECRALNAGFFSVMECGRPLVMLKLATSLDGKIADAYGKSRWITGEQSRRYGHFLRGQYDAILTGIGTVLADDPALTCRLPGREGDSPLRIVADSQLRIPLTAKLLTSPSAWIMTTQQAFDRNKEKGAELVKRGAEIVALHPTPTLPRKGGGRTRNEGGGDGEGLPLAEMLKLLAQKGITRLMVEAGKGLASAMVSARLVDEVCWFRAPLVIGEGGLSALSGQNEELSALSRWKRRQVERLGEDMLEIYDCPSI